VRASRRPITTGDPPHASGPERSREPSKGLTERAENLSAAPDPALEQFRRGGVGLCRRKPRKSELGACVARAGADARARSSERQEEPLTTTTQEAERRPARRQVMQQALWKRVLKRPEAGALGGAILVFLFFSAMAPPFRQVAAFTTVLYQASTIGIPAVAVAMLMIGGEFDLSAGVAVTSSSLAASIFATQIATMIPALDNIWIGVVFALLFSLAIGALNGFLLIRTKLHSFLVTLATFLMLQGLNIAITKLITGDVATGDISTMPGFDLGQAIFASNFQFGNVQVSIAIIYWFIFVAIGTWVLLRTRVGNWIFAVGGQGDSARAVGVPVTKVKIGLFMLVGFGCWFLAMHQLFAYDTVQSGAGIGNELLYIAAAVVGGCLLTGGYGSAVGSALGAFIFGMTTEGVIYADWDPDWFQFFVGAMLLLATVVNTWIRARASSGR
jgi:simple sugar transport system permease protein